MLLEVNYDAEEEKKAAKLEKVLAQRKVMENMTSEEKVSYILESFDL
jgi:hypothetical protein